MTFREIGRLGGAFDVEQVIKFFGPAFETNAVDCFGVERDQEENFAGDFENEGVSPLFYPGCLWQ